VFLHGFQQWPPAHISLLQPLADLGILVVAPIADIGQIITDASKLFNLRYQMDALQVKDPSSGPALSISVHCFWVSPTTQRDIIQLLMSY
jgi:hypothetical protein